MFDALFTMPFLVMSIIVLFFSVAVVDWPHASEWRRANFNLRDLLWMGVVAFSIGWPSVLVYLVPSLMTALVVTSLCLLIMYELLRPCTELRSWKLYQSVPKSAWWILGVCSVGTAWLTLLFIVTEAALGRSYVSPVAHWFG